MNKPKHSPLGASGAERWMHCPGSNVLLKALNLPPSDEEDYQVQGSAAHEAAAHCIINKLDAWEVIGEKFYGATPVTGAMAEAVQVYLDYVNGLRASASASWWCEFHISDDLHPLFYGTVDFAVLADGTLEVVDFKYGEGIIVEPEMNPQLLYYAYGLLQHQPGARRVKLTIVQPRAWHPDSRIRSFELSADEVAEWGEKTLLPAMQAAEIDETLDAGPWCRFCPAKLACPLLHGLFKAAANINPKIIVNLNDEAAARDYRLREAVKFYLKAQEQDMFRRLSGGRKIEGVKIVNKKADRVYKPGAEAALRDGLGVEDLYTAPKLKSPAEVEKLGKKAKELVKEWAYMPMTGYTVALAEDRRLAVNIQSTAEAFGAAIDKLREDD